MQTPPTLSVGHFWPTALTKGGVKAYAAVVKGAELLIIELFIYKWERPIAILGSPINQRQQCEMRAR
jgi:hypothetical protein